jgi:hypothetical protein
LIVISVVTFVEFTSALRRRWLMGDLSSDHRMLVSRRFIADAESFVIVEFTPTIRARASSLLSEEGRITGRLRGMDAIQLASAEAWQRQTDAVDHGLFVVSDGPLRNAATVIGLAVEDPEDYGDDGNA